MTMLWAAFIGGLLGSTHCVGMCGPFAAVIGLRAKSFGASLRAQLLYSAGRILTYAVLGGISGFAGKRLASAAPQLVNVPAILCLLAGVLLVREGLAATGLWPRRIGGGSGGGCLLGPMFGALLRMPGARNTFAAGVFTGMLPCGLLYAYVALAAGTGDLIGGSLLMIVFGLGTVPLMTLAGCGAGLLSATAQQRLWRVAGWAVVMTGALTVARGAAFLQTKPAEQPPPCPFCVGADHAH